MDSAVIGETTAVERFLESAGLASKVLQLSRVASSAAALVQAGSEIAANAGRWLKLTQESADKVKKLGLTQTNSPGVSYAMIGKPEKIQSWIKVANSPGSLLSNPVVLTGAAGIMAQLAMQQAMAEITDYLAKIDAKVDDILRAQTNQVLARLDGVGLAIQEAERVRETVGRVSEVTWSKVQDLSSTILEIQGYALRQLKDLAEKMENKNVGELAKGAQQAQTDVQKWLSVLALCFKMHDAIGVLELDRVLDESPEELDRHRLGLKAARRDRVELIEARTNALLIRMLEAATTANSKVLFNPIESPAIVEASNQVAAGVHGFHQVLGVESGNHASEARRWGDAANAQLDKVRRAGAQGLDSVKQFGSDARDKARSVRNKLAVTIEAKRGRRDEPVAPYEHASQPGGSDD